MLSKSDLLAIKLETREVKLSQGSVLIKEFTASDREGFELLALNMTKGKGAKNMKAKLISVSVVNEQGGRVFGDDEVAQISQMPSRVTEEIFNEILSLNGMAGDAVAVEMGN